MKKRYSFLQLSLTVMFVVALLLSNIVWAKQLWLPFGIASTAALILFPITYVLSDVFSEVYWYRWSRITCYIWFAANLFMCLIFAACIAMPSSPFRWNQEAFATILWSTPRVVFASLLGFVVGDFCNDRVFRKMKEKYQNTTKRFGWRALVSSMVWEAIDSAIFIPIAFFGSMPFNELVKMWAVYVAMKVLYEAIILPITTLIMKRVKKHEDNLLLNEQ